jgi:serine/threonine protein phosphatase PrpC
MEAVKAGLIEWAVAEHARHDQTESGDRALAIATADGALVAVVDGLGHGSEAADVARLAVRSLEHHASEPLIPLVRHCHGALGGTRGAVVSLARFSARDATMAWLGVGNVEGLLLRAHATTRPPRETLLVRGGVVGVRLPALAAATVPVSRGDTLILATDGVHGDFVDQALPHRDPPQRVADHVLRHWGSRSDDALVLVVRYLGIEP